MPVKLGARPDHGFDQPLGLLSDCHRRIENFLSVLQRAAQQAAGRALDPNERETVETALTYFRTAAPRHTRDEEESLFPLLRQLSDPRVREAMEIVESLEKDHASADCAHREVETLYQQWIQHGSLRPTEGARLAQLLADLVQLYRRHIALEDQQIFPLAGQVLNVEQLRQVGLQMAQRRGVISSL